MELDCSGRPTREGRFNLALAMLRQGFGPQEIQRETGWTVAEVQERMGIVLAEPTPLPGEVTPGATEAAGAPGSPASEPQSEAWPPVAARSPSPFLVPLAATLLVSMMAGGAWAMAAPRRATVAAAARPAVVQPVQVVQVPQVAQPQPEPQAVVAQPATPDAGPPPCAQVTLTPDNSCTAPDGSVTTLLVPVGQQQQPGVVFHWVLCREENIPRGVAGC